MTKKYYTPMLQIVSIKNHDLLCTSPLLSIGDDLTIGEATNGIIQAGSAGRRFDDYDGF